MPLFLVGVVLILLSFVSSRASAPPVRDYSLYPFQLTEDTFFFRAAAVSAIFRDGNWARSDNMHYNATAIGDLVSFKYRNGQNPDDIRQVRLYFIPPEKDWQSNQTYRWKLNQAWMSDLYYGWVYWNVNGYIDSQVKTSDQYDVFQCEYMEFQYYHNAVKGRYDATEGTLVLNNVEMGAFLPLGYNEESLIRYNPCAGQGPCRAIDGIVYCDNGMVWQYSLLVISFVGAVLIVAATSPQYRSVQEIIESTSRYSRVGGDADGGIEMDNVGQVDREDEQREIL